MRKIVAGLFIALDGVAEAPDQWHFPYFNDEMGDAVGAQLAAADTMLLGRQTYEEFASYWPDSKDDIADYMNNTPKLVVSTTLDKPEWANTTVIRGIDELAARKQQEGKNISATGSISLVRSLLQAGVLDELHLLIHPIAVGQGKRLFAEDGQQVPLQLMESRALSTGVIYAIYAPAHAA